MSAPSSARSQSRSAKAGTMARGAFGHLQKLGGLRRIEQQHRTEQIDLAAGDKPLTSRVPKHRARDEDRCRNASGTLRGQGGRARLAPKVGKQGNERPIRVTRALMGKPVVAVLNRELHCREPVPRQAGSNDVHAGLGSLRIAPKTTARTRQHREPTERPVRGPIWSMTSSVPHAHLACMPEREAKLVPSEGSSPGSRQGGDGGRIGSKGSAANIAIVAGPNPTCCRPFTSD